MAERLNPFFVRSSVQTGGALEDIDTIKVLIPSLSGIRFKPFPNREYNSQRSVLIRFKPTMLTD